jgi:hypothetical protein
MPCWDVLILAKAECGLVHVRARSIGTITTKIFVLCVTLDGADEPFLP